MNNLLNIFINNLLEHTIQNKSSNYKKTKKNLSFINFKNRVITGDSTYTQCFDMFYVHLFSHIKLTAHSWEIDLWIDERKERS